MIACPNLSNPDVAREFNELVNATSEAAAYRIWSLNNGNGIDKAPNGAESRLFKTLLDYYDGDRTKAIQAKAKTYSKSFLEWFGDWIGDLEKIANSKNFAQSEAYKELEKYANDGTGIHAELIKFFINNFGNDIKNYNPRLGSGMFKVPYGEILFPRYEWGKEDGDFEYKENRKIALHELIHSITSHLLIGYYVAKNNKWEKEFRDAGYEGEIPTLSKAQIAAFDELVEIKKKVSKHFDTHPEDINSVNNPFGSNTYYRMFEMDYDGMELDEFISEAFSNPTLQAVMAKIPSSKGSKKTIFDIVIELLGKVFNIKGTLLEDFINVANDAISERYINNADVSKVVDENGEPRVMYHGSDDVFDEFSYDFFGKTDPGDNGRGFYFAYESRVAYQYGDVLYPVFLNVRHPFIHTGIETASIIKGFNRVSNPTKREVLEDKISLTESRLRFDKDQLKELDDDFHVNILTKRILHNEVLLKKQKEDLENTPEEELDKKIFDTLDDYDAVIEEDEHYQIVIRNENQIKHIDNSGAYSNSKNIYDSQEEYDELSKFIWSDKESYVQAKMRQFFLDSKIDLTELVNEEQSIVLLELAQKEIHRWAEDRLNLILGRTQRALASAFGLVQQEDGSWATDSKSPYAQLRVEFVNSMSQKGSYTHASFSGAAHHLIQIGLTYGDATTFNHELAHHYVRMFWNSKPIQDALNVVYDKKMGDLSDPKVREAVEEKLVDLMTERSVDDMFKSNIEHLSNFLTFWEGFNKLLYKVFNIKSKAARKAFIDAATMSFMINEQLENDMKSTYVQMYEGTVFLKSEYQKRAAKNKQNEGYNIYNMTRQDETVTQHIVAATQSKAKAYQLRSVAGQEGNIYGSADQMAANQEAVRQVRIQKTLIEEAHQAKDAQTELHEKANLFHGFLLRSVEEVTRILGMFNNAAANDFKKVMFTTDIKGNRSYTTLSGELITDDNNPLDSKETEFGFDELQYAAEDVIGFIQPMVESIVGIVNDAKMLGYSDADIQMLEEFINNSRIQDLINSLSARYKNALRTKLFNWIDQTVEERDELNEDFKNRLKINMKKWILEQQDYGDVSILEVAIGIGSHSKSPIIRAMQDFINEMQQDRDQATYLKGIYLMDLKRKAERKMGLKYKLLPYNFQKLLMQLDKRGLPTGYFISEINKGQYLQDLNNKRDELLFGGSGPFGKPGLEQKLKNLVDDDGNPVFVDTDGNPIEKLQFDEYGFPVVPKNDNAELLVKEYLKELESWKCEHANRLFTSKYYMLRIEHLSLDALRALNKVNSKIEAIVEAVTINGVPRMDLLSPSQQLEYQTYEKERQFLGSIYDQDGNLKDPDSEEFAIAQSIRNFRIATRGKIVYKTNWDAYNEAASNAKDDKAFHRMFSHWQVNPKIWDMIHRMSSLSMPYGVTHEMIGDEDDIQILAGLLYDRATLISQFLLNQIGEIAWDQLYDKTNKKLKRENLWATLKKLDEDIEFYQQSIAKKRKLFFTNHPEIHREKIDFKFENILESYDIPVDRGGDWYNAETVFERIKKNIEDAVNSDPNLTEFEKHLEIFRQLNLIQYYSTKHDTSDNPLSIFTTYLPKYKWTVDDNGEQYEDFVQVPSSVFNVIDKEQSDREYVNQEYDTTSSEYEQPKKELYKDNRYAKYVQGNYELERLLEALKDTMQESWGKIPFLGQYDDRLSQIGARTGQILGRKIGTRLFQNLGEFFRREWEVVETDTEFAPDGDVQRRPDGSKIKNIPIRFVKMLERPEYISADLVGSVIQFFDMAENYRLKAEKSSLLTQLFAALQQNKTSDSKSGSYQQQVIEGILNRQVYENNATAFGLENRDSGENSWKHFDWMRKYIINADVKAWIKRIGKARVSFLMGMLALNMTSGIVSFLDPAVSLIIDSLTGKYINVMDDINAIRYLFGNGIQNLASLGKIKSQGKLAAAMQKFQLGKSNRETFKNTDQGLVMRFLGDGLMMKHFSWGDYTMNAISLIATMNNYRAYEASDGTIKFYYKSLFIQKCMEDMLCDADTARSIYRKSKKMWNSCEVDRRTGEFVAKNNKYGRAIDNATWSAVRKLTRSRSSIYNGIVSDVERTAMQTNTIFAFFTMLRNFIITGIWERFKNFRDFQVTTFDENGNPTIENITTRITSNEAKHTLLYYKGGISFDTRQIEDGVDTTIANWLRHLLPYLSFMVKSFASPFASKFFPSIKGLRNTRSTEYQNYLKAHNLNANSIYGAQKILLEVFLAIGLWLLSGVTKKAADDDKDNYWMQMLYLINIRTAIERMTWFNPNTMLEFFQSPTTAFSDWKRRLFIFDLLSDAIGLGGHSLTEEVKTGNFRKQSRWKYDVANAFSNFGLYNWYTNMPESLGGGGAYTIRKKADWYGKYTPDAVNTFLSGEKKKSSTRRSRGGSSRGKSGRGGSKRGS